VREASRTDDFVIVKYAPDGNLLWADRYNSPQNNHETATAIALSPAGDVLVTGRSSSTWGEPITSTTIKYTSDGFRQWVSQYPFEHSVAPAIGVDSAGNVTLTGSSRRDFVTVRFNHAGQLVWTASYNGPGWTTDSAKGVALDHSGNVLVLGDASEGDQSSLLVQKYTPTSMLLWEDRLEPGSDSSPTYFALDGSNNLYVTGMMDGASDRFLIKYDSLGNRLWQVRYDSPDQGDDRARFLAVDPASYSYVVGETFNHATNRSSLLILHYDPNGNLLWVRRDEEGIYPDHIARDPFGNLYVAAIADTLSYLAQYSPTGERLWSLTLPGWGWRLAVDAMGNLYAAGHAENRYILAQYDPQGNLLWLDSHLVLEGGLSSGGDLELDGRGYLYVQNEQDSIR